MVVRLCIFLVHKMAVVCADELYTITFCQCYKMWLHLLLFFIGFAVGKDCRIFYLMALKFDIKVFTPYVFEPFHTF